MQNSFPLIKAFVNFEERKKDAGNIFFKDWRVATSPNAEVLSAFVSDMTTYKNNVIDGTLLDFTCDGAVVIKTAI